MESFVNRRLFLKLTGMSLALSVASPSVARRLSSPRRRPEDIPGPRPAPDAQTDVPTFVLIFLRGGADAQNMVIATEPGEYATYQGYRPTLYTPMIDMQTTGTLLTDASGADVQWGLHPSFQSAMPLWQAGRLAIFPQVHYDDGSRSHFDSQQFYDNGTPGEKFTSDGWMNRHLATAPTADPLLRAIAFDGIVPFSLQGGYPTLTFTGINNLNVSGNTGRNDRYLNTQEIVYPSLSSGPRTWDPEVAGAGKSLIDAIRWIQATSLPPTDPAANYPLVGNTSYFGQRLRDLAQLIKSNAFAIELVEIDLHGWDTHNLQLNGHPALVRVLSDGLQAFFTDLGDTFARNVVVGVISEFGRTARENGSAGTDHGNATFAMVAGHESRVLGRRIYHGPSGYKSLTDLRDGRDVKHSVDFRDLFGEIVQRHLGNTSPDVFPGHVVQPLGFLA